MNVVVMNPVAPQQAKVRCECAYCGAHMEVRPSLQYGGRCQNCGCHLLRPLAAADGPAARLEAMPAARPDRQHDAGPTLPVSEGADVDRDDARRLANELHDGALQELTLARLQLDLLMAGQDDPFVAEELAELSDALQHASLKLQGLMRRLGARPTIV